MRFTRSLAGFVLLLVVVGLVGAALKLQQGQALYTVASVVDGDTIMLDNGERVRYIGIDTPETVHPSKPVECYGPEASARNKELVAGKRVRLETDTTDRDQYGRLLRYVYVGQTFVNAVLVREGYAYSYYYPPDVKRYQEFVKLEQEAKALGRGLWSACPR